MEGVNKCTSWFLQNVIKIGNIFDVWLIKNILPPSVIYNKTSYQKNITGFRRIFVLSWLFSMRWKAEAVSQSILLFGFHFMFFILLKKTYWKHSILSIQTSQKHSNCTEKKFLKATETNFPWLFFSFSVKEHCLQLPWGFL